MGRRGQRARTWLRRGEPKKAVDDATAAIKIEPRDETYGIRGDAYRKLRQYGQAIADYNTAQRIDQDVADTWSEFAETLKQSGHIAEAQDALRRAAEFKALNAPAKVAAIPGKPQS